MNIYYFIVVIGIIILLYGIWFSYIKIALNVKSYFNINTIEVFNVILFSLILAIFIARIGYIVANWEFYKQFGFSFLPYIKFKNNSYVLTAFPWRILRFAEGFDKILLYIFWLALSFIFLPIKWMLRYKNILAKDSNVKMPTLYFGELFVFLFLLITISVFWTRLLSLIK